MTSYLTVSFLFLETCSSELTIGLGKRSFLVIKFILSLLLLNNNDLHQTKLKKDEPSHPSEIHHIALSIFIFFLNFKSVLKKKILNSDHQYDFSKESSTSNLSLLHDA